MGIIYRNPTDDCVPTLAFVQCDMFRLRPAEMCLMWTSDRVSGCVMITSDSSLESSFTYISIQYPICILKTLVRQENKQILSCLKSVENFLLYIY